MQKSLDSLQDRARDILGELGYGTAGHDGQRGLSINFDVIRHIADTDQVRGPLERARRTAGAGDDLLVSLESATARARRIELESDLRRSADGDGRDDADEPRRHRPAAGVRSRSTAGRGPGHRRQARALAVALRGRRPGHVALPAGDARTRAARRLPPTEPPGKGRGRIARQSSCASKPRLIVAPRSPSGSPAPGNRQFHGRRRRWRSRRSGASSRTRWAPSCCS